MITFLWIVTILLVLASIIDLRFRSIPSVLLTGIVFFVAFLNPSNIFYGIMGFIMAYLLYEGGFFSGIGDLKVMVSISFLISTTQTFFIFLILIGIYGLIWKVMWKWRFRKEKNCPFIPVLFFVYLTLVFGGLI